MARAGSSSTFGRRCPSLKAASPMFNEGAGLQFGRSGPRKPDDAIAQRQVLELQGGARTRGYGLYATDPLTFGMAILLLVTAGPRSSPSVHIFLTIPQNYRSGP